MGQDRMNPFSAVIGDKCSLSPSYFGHLFSLISQHVWWLVVTFIM